MNMKKIAAILGLCLMAGSARAAQPWATGGATSVYELSFSTPAATPQLVSAGAGSFGSATLSSSTVGAYCAFFDSASASGFSTPYQAGTNAAPRIAELSFITANTPSKTAVNEAAPFRNGLVVVCDKAAILTCIGSRN